MISNKLTHHDNTCKTMYHGKTKTDSNIGWNRPISRTFREEEELMLMQDSSRALAAAKDPMEKLRLLCLSRGSTGILGLGRVFRRMDHDGSHQLNKEEFFYGMKDTGLELNTHEAIELFERFDTGNSGSISFEEFLTQIRPPMSKSRRAIVEQAFKKLDRAGDGVITVDDIRDVSSVPAHLRESDEEDFVTNKFLATFESEGIADGKVTLHEFMDYYSVISMSIDDDRFFDLMMRRAFKL